MRRARAAALLLALAAPAAAAAPDDPPVHDVAETDPAIVALRDKLKNDPAALEAAAARLAKSRLISEIEPEKNEDIRLAAARGWIKSDPNSAARIMIGLAHDDESGKTDYEDTLIAQFDKSYDAFRNRGGAALRGLRRTGKESQSLKKQGDDMSDDEKKEILRTLFEGQGAQSGKVITNQDQGGGRSSASGAGPAAATAFNGLYDRLNSGNLRGYSPQLLSLQSALSSRRPPGAPKLVETGKLDYPTLSYPSYGMSYDEDNLEKRLRQERVFQLARLAGRVLTANDWRDPTLEAKLAAQVPVEKLPPRLKRRAELIAKARAAQASFVESAEKARNQNGITRGLLVELGGKQKETARWIADAALEEELSRADDLEGFLTPELLAAIDAAPVPAEERASYKRRGEALKAKVSKLKENALKAQRLLESDGWTSALGDVDKLVAEDQNLKRALPSDVRDYARVPYAVAESQLVQPRWRVWLDDLAIKWASSLSYSRGVALRRGRLSRYIDVFGLIASGDAPGAHAALANETGER